MPETLTSLLALLFLVLGAVLLGDRVSNSDVDQTARVIGGAAFLALGLIGGWMALKHWWKWRTFYKEYRE